MIDHKYGGIIHVHIHRCAGVSVEDFFNSPYVYDHRTVEDYIDQFGQEIWDDYYTFAFIRNPWAKMLSHYFWRQQRAWWYAKGDELKFGEWIKNFDILTKGNRKLEDRNENQYDWLFDGSGNRLVDYVGKVETIDHDWRIICQRIGVDYKPLPKSNSTNHKHYSEYYAKETKEIVRERYSKDIDAFGYEFETREESDNGKTKVEARLESLGYLE